MNSANQDLIKHIYLLLDQFPTAQIDCGELCDRRCCCYNVPEDKEAGMELVPGEETVFPITAAWHRTRFLPATEYDYPAAWSAGKGLWQIRCVQPCPRNERPIACRIFPFQVYREKGVYYLGLIGSHGYYDCPLGEKTALVNPEFIQAAREAAGLLLQIPEYKELVDWDSAGLDTKLIKLKIKL